MEELADYFKTAIFDGTVKNYPKGQALIYKNDLPMDIMVLKSGIIKIFDVDDNQNEKILHLVKPFGIVPFAMFSGGQEKVQWCYSALTDCQVNVIPFEDFYKYLKSHSEFAIYLMNWFSIEAHEILVRLSSLGKTSAENKIKAALRFLAVHHSKKLRGQWVQVVFSVNHQLVADMTGVTRERAAMIMKELADQKVIRNPKQNTLELNLSKLLN